MNSFFYYRISGPGVLPDANANWGKFLDVLGRNRMKAPLSLYPGKENAPAWGFYEDERTGPFSDGTGRIGWSFFGKKGLVMVDGGFEVWDRSNRLWGFLAPIDYLATADTDIVAGQPVSAVDSLHVVLSDPDTTDPAIGVAVHSALSGEQVRVRTEGILRLDGWSTPTGSPTLSDPDYYLAASGTLTATPGTQLICSRLGPNTVRVRCTAGGTGGSVTYQTVVCPNSATTLSGFDVTGKRGRVFFEDDLEGFCVIRVTGTKVLMLEGNDDYVFGSPGSTQVRVHVSGTEIAFTTGSAAARSISWRYEGP